VAAVVVADLGYVGLPLAIETAAGGHEVIGYDTEAVWVKRLGAEESYVEDVSFRELATPLNSGRFCPPADADICTSSAVALIVVPPASGRPARLGVRRGGQPDAGPLPAPRLDGDPGVRVLHRGHPGTGPDLLEEGSGLAGGPRLPPRLRPREHHPGRARGVDGTRPGPRQPALCDGHPARG
jgi:UDP-N-acetyl-D-glucosamine dehydrogenase